MAKYQVAVIRRPEGFVPAQLDDAPATLGDPLSVLAEADDLFEAVGRAIEHNRSDETREAGRWAVVVEPGSLGRIWPAARLCTPITYKVTAIWWPEGWEPASPLDVPHCVWRAQGEADRQPLSLRRALATVRGLNRQCMAQPSSTWYVVVAVENEPVSRTVSFDAAGMETRVEVRRMHAIRPEQGGHGSCAHCPAHDFQCAKTDWTSQVQTLTTTESRTLGG